MPEEKATQPRRILIAEDSRLQGIMLKRDLTRSGFEVRWAQDGALALQELQEWVPDLIVSDIEMPNMDGYAFCRGVKQNQALQNIPVILLSTLGDPEDIIRGLQAGADNYVTKPYELDYLLSRIGSLLSTSVVEDGTADDTLTVVLAGEKFEVSSGRQQVLNLLISTFENAVETSRKLAEKNQALAEAQNRLEIQNTQLSQTNKDLGVRNEFIRRVIGTYLTDEIAETILESPEGLQLGGEDRNVTILMSDLRGFTSMSEGMSAAAVTSVINNYLAAMTDIILKYGGTIDEFIGDAILVVFGAPLQQPNHAANAVACAMEMQLAMTTVNQFNRQNGHPPISMGIGINTGSVIVGNIGCEKRMKYGVVGSNVNLTARIESFTLGGQILISKSTKDAIADKLRIDGMLRVKAKGVEGPVPIYDVGGIAGEFNFTMPEREAM